MKKKKLKDVSMSVSVSDTCTDIFDLFMFSNYYQCSGCPCFIGYMLVDESKTYAPKTFKKKVREYKRDKVVSEHSYTVIHCFKAETEKENHRRNVNTFATKRCYAYENTLTVVYASLLTKKKCILKVQIK